MTVQHILAYEEEDACMAYEEEDTWMAYEEEHVWIDGSMTVQHIHKCT
jgi:hypothetical protein